jgi:hypothetical protein
MPVEYLIILCFTHIIAAGIGAALAVGPDRL